MVVVVVIIVVVVVCRRRMSRRREKSAGGSYVFFCVFAEKKRPPFFFFFVSKIHPFHETELFELSRERETETKTSRHIVIKSSSSSRENKVPSRLKSRHGSLDDHKKGAGGESPKERRLVFCLLDFLAFCALFF